MQTTINDKTADMLSRFGKIGKKRLNNAAKIAELEALRNHVLYSDEYTGEELFTILDYENSIVQTLGYITHAGKGAR